MIKNLLADPVSEVALIQKTRVVEKTRLGSDVQTQVKAYEALSQLFEEDTRILGAVHAELMA
jgi:hypothetical protein